MYNRYESLEGSCNALEEHYRNLEHEYYQSERNKNRKLV